MRPIRGRTKLKQDKVYTVGKGTTKSYTRFVNSSNGLQFRDLEISLSEHLHISAASSGLNVKGACLSWNSSQFRIKRDLMPSLKFFRFFNKYFHHGIRRFLLLRVGTCTPLGITMMCRLICKSSINDQLARARQKARGAQFWWNHCRQHRRRDENSNRNQFNSISCH